MPLTSISMESTRAALRWSKRSRTTARPITWPEQPPTPCANRAPIRNSKDGDRAQARDAARKTPAPTSIGPRRPHRSAANP